VNKTRVLYITAGEYFDNHHRKLLSVIRNLEKDKYEFSIVSNENILFMEYLKTFDVPVYALNLPGRISSKYSTLLNKLQLGEKFHIVHSFDYVSGIYSRLLKKFNSEIKCIHSPDSLVTVEHKSVFTKQLVKSTMQYYSLFTDRLICENEFEKKTSIKNKYIDKEKAAVISPSVNIARFANLKKDLELKSSLGFDRDNFIIGSLSNFGENNNQQLIIRSAYYLVKKYPQMRFLFIGSGKKLRLMQELVRESRLEEYVVFINEHENLPDYYSIIDLFILADIFGGSAFVLLEAMASNLPVICSITAEYLPFSRSDKALMSFDPKDMDDLFEKITFIYQDKEKRETLAQNAMIEATQYDDSEIFPKIESVYTEVLRD
jgi:glycosyltransferase involved in cell wall biosynthesis